MIPQNHTYGSALPHLRHSARKGSVLTLIFALQDLWRGRRALRRMDASRLDDLGLSREAAEAEANRPVWDAPRNWFQ